MVWVVMIAKNINNVRNYLRKSAILGGKWYFAAVGTLEEICGNIRFIKNLKQHES